MKVAVLQGGPSLEAAVSRVSAAGVAEALRASGQEVELFELEPEMPAALLRYQPDVVFPALHGAQGEDGCVQGLLEVLRLPYVGSGVLGSATAASKVATKGVYRAIGLPVARDRVLSVDARNADPAFLLDELRRELGPRLIVKPPLGGSALGIARLLDEATPSDLARAIAEVSAIDDEILVEEYVTGMELTCGVLEEGNSLRALPPTLISAAAADWYDFKSKYGTGGSSHQCPAPIDPELTRAIQDAAVRAHQALGLRDLSRTDVLLAESGDFVLLETNTLPGMTQVSLFPEAAAAAGISFEDLVLRLCKGALSRGGFAPRPETAMPS